MSLNDGEKQEAPCFNDNKMKLGTFGSNLHLGTIISKAQMEDSSFEPTYEHNIEIAKKAEEYGFEMCIPVGRWRGLGTSKTETNPHGSGINTFPWAASLAPHTENIMLFSTTTVNAYHPIVAAQEGASIDAISDGRYGLNIVSGWFGPEKDMFGAQQLEHDKRYEKAEGFATILKRLWTEENFDYEDEFYSIKDGYCSPKPKQRPHPPIMNAGNSKAGRDFSGEYADLNFVALDSIEDGKEAVEDVQEKAQKYGRDISVMTYGTICCADTEEKAKEEYNLIIEKGDEEGAKEIMRHLGMESGSFDKQIEEKMTERFISGWGGWPIVGTPEQVTAELETLNNIGLDGIALTFLDYVEGIEYFGENVIPLLEEKGLRTGKYPNS